MKVLLIDDEELALVVLEKLIEQVEGIEIIGKYSCSQLAFQKLEKVEADVVFLDMEMEAIHGLQFAEKLMTSFPLIDIIFVTAHPQFALEAFEVNAIDYLLKPVNLERLTKAIDKAKEKKRLYASEKQGSKREDQSLIVRSFGTFHVFNQQQNEVKWRTKKGKELFAYLWHHNGNAVHRARIMDDLWPMLPENRAAQLLHTTVYQVRKNIKEMGIDQAITFLNGHYVLDVEVESDIAQLKKAFQTLEPTHPAIEEIMGLYKGNYMEGEDYHWALHEQIEVKRLLLNYLENYISITKKDESLHYLVEHCLEKMVELEPYNERYIVLLLEHYGNLHRPQKIDAFFHKTKEMWTEEIGLELPQEIVGLYGQRFIYE